MNDTLPLAGLNIVVTRPRNQLTELDQRIRKLGGNCIQFPLLEISALSDLQPLRNLIKRLHKFKLAIFISPNAVRYAMEMIRKAGGLPQDLKVATVGLGSAKVLNELGVNHVISPTEKFDSESLLELPELKNVQGLPVVIFRGDPGRTLLGDTLKNRGAEVEYITCYHRTKLSFEVSDFLDNKPNILYVTSNEVMQYFFNMLDTKAIEKLSDVTLFVSNARIASTAQQRGWSKIMVSDDGDEGFLTSIVVWAENKKRQA